VNVLRRIIAFNHVSADGYFATDDGKLDWVVPDEELTQSNLRNMGEADTILFGRRTYEMFESFWPNAIKDPQGAEDEKRRQPARCDGLAPVNSPRASNNHSRRRGVGSSAHARRLLATRCSVRGRWRHDSPRSLPSLWQCSRRRHGADLRGG
jgi:hypothetical protein